MYRPASILPGTSVMKMTMIMIMMIKQCQDARYCIGETYSSYETIAFILKTCFDRNCNELDEFFSGITRQILVFIAVITLLQL